MNKNSLQEWYAEAANDADANLWMEVLASVRKRYNISFGDSTEEGKSLIRELVRAEFEAEKARRENRQLDPSKVLHGCSLMRTKE